MSDAICRECETVAHCTKHGCIPKVRDTIDMAREAGFTIGPSRDGPDDVWGVGANLERFVALVRADEREACAKECKFDRTAADIEIAIRARGETK